MSLTDGFPFMLAFWRWLLHLGNFALPALALATLLAPVVVGRRRLCARLLWQAWRWLAVTGLLVLVAGLLLSGRDGKIATYAALVLSVGSLCCWLQWHRPTSSTAMRELPRRPERR